MRAHKDAKSGFREPQDFVVLLQSFAGPVTWSDLAPCATFQVRHIQSDAGIRLRRH